MRYPEPVRAYGAMNTVRALELIACGPLSAPQLAASLQVGVASARRLLKRLALEGFVTQERGHRRRYHATLRLAALGRHMLDRSPLVQAAAPCVDQLAQDTYCAAHLWIPGYDEQVVCAVHADARAGRSMLSARCGAARAASSAAGHVLRDRSEPRSYLYVRVHQTEEPAAAAAVIERRHVVAALGLTGGGAHDGTAAVVAAAARLSKDLAGRP
jgi:DNA-binding IclR family transcriptional regulator